MPVTTYMQRPLEAPKLENSELQQLLCEVRAVDSNWWIQEYRQPDKGWFTKRKVYHYELLHFLSAHEAQVINFYRDGSDTSINPFVGAELVFAYLYGWLGGYDDKPSPGRACDRALLAAASPTPTEDALDAKRLDWLSEHEAWIGWNREGDMCSVFTHGDEDDNLHWVRLTPAGTYFTHRAAIDAAIASTQTKGETP